MTLQDANRMRPKPQPAYREERWARDPAFSIPCLCIYSEGVPVTLHNDAGVPPISPTCGTPTKSTLLASSMPRGVQLSMQTNAPD